MSDSTATTTSCCTPDGSCGTGQDARDTGGTGQVTTVYQVTGMTCGHCVTAVSQELDALAEVGAVHVELSTGRVSVTTDGAPDDTRIAAAVDEAGYELTGRASEEN